MFYIEALIEWGQIRDQHFPGKISKFEVNYFIFEVWAQ